MNSSSLRRAVVCAILVAFASACQTYAQPSQFDKLLLKGKQRFMLGEDYATQWPVDKRQMTANYREAVALLEEAIRLNSNSQEAHYFLAYAYDRLFSSRGGADRGRDLPGTGLQETIQISRELEKVLAISPEYHGDTIILTPTEKMSSTWGSLALRYIVHGKTDSATWAFREGRQRGGFTDQLLDHCRSILKECEEKAILFVSSDMETFPIWYLQQVEKVRTDVTLVNLTLTSAAWYTVAMKEGLQFEQSPMPLMMTTSDIYLLDSTRADGTGFFDPYLKEPLEVMIERDGESPLTFTVPGRAYGEDRYLVMQDHVLIDLLQANRDRRPFYFTAGTARELQPLGLDTLLVTNKLTHRLTIPEAQQ